MSSDQVEPASIPPVATLAYAQGSSHASLIDIRPHALLIPNLAAVVVCFLPISYGESPIGPIVSYVGHYFGRTGHWDIWEAFITGPFLLSIPLAIWTIRLCVQPRSTRREAIVAWSITLTALTMTLLACGYAAVVGGKHPLFLVAVLAALAILVAAAVAVWTLRIARSAYPPALLAMTAVYAANATLTLLIVLTHSPLESGSVAGTIVVVAQLIALAVLYRGWRDAGAGAASETSA
jgi:hypothetical protein